MQRKVPMDSPWGILGCLLGGSLALDLCIWDQGSGGIQMLAQSGQHKTVSVVHWKNKQYYVLNGLQHHKWNLIKATKLNLIKAFYILMSVKLYNMTAKKKCYAKLIKTTEKIIIKQLVKLLIFLVQNGTLIF